MPEITEVETYRRVAEEVVGATIGGIHVDDELLARNSTAAGLGRALTGSTITAAERHGKWVWLTTDAASDLLVHFGMTGSFHVHSAASERGEAEHPSADEHEFDHVRVDLEDGRCLALHMPRKLGGVWRVAGPEHREEVTDALGPDAMDVDGDDLRERLGGSRGGLKAMLMDQSKVAGLGNLLSDELCWQVRVHPATACTEVDDDVWDAIADELARAIDVGLDLGHVPTTDGFLLDVRGEEDASCPRHADTTLRSGTIAGRTSYWCPACQPDPR